MSKREIAITTIGVLFILAGLLLNERLLATFTSDGRIDSGGQLMMIRLFNIVSIILGIAIILLRKSDVVGNLMIAGLITVVIFFILDTLLYFASPMMPESMVLAMSPNAQVRYFHANADSLPWVYDENVRYAKANTGFELFNVPVQSDDLGYRNPEGYLDEQERMDIVLLGDSFVWGTEEGTIADSLRHELAPLGVYSLGMVGSGIPQWQYHFERYATSPYFKEDPQLAVLNFYSGNDVTDTEVFAGLQQAEGSVDSADFYTYINHQYLVPKPDQSFKLPKFPEFLFLANYTYASLRNAGSQSTALTETGENTAPMCLKHREPYPRKLTGGILNQLTIAAESIRKMSPDTEIVLSYIPTSSGIYGDSMTGCPDKQNDITLQEGNSRLLAAHADEQGIHYVDVTPGLREAAKTEIVWSPIDHFSPLGYQIYASLLAEAIEPLLEDK